MKPLRILFIGWEWPPHITGGLGVACHGLAQALARRGHSVIVLLPRLYGDEAAVPGVALMDPACVIQEIPDSDKRGMCALSLLAVFPELTGIYDSKGTRPLNGGKEFTSQRVGGANTIFLQGGYGGRAFVEAEMFSRLAALLVKRLPLDVIHAHDWITYPAGLVASAATGLPLICHVHATEFDRSGGGVNQHVYELERYALGKCTAVVAVSNLTKDVLTSRYAVPADKVFSVHNGIERELLRPTAGLPSRGIGERIVLFLGRMTFQKGPEYFVQAARLVINRIPNVRFVMAGTGDMFRRVIELAADIGIGKYFHYTGFLNKADAHRLYDMSALYIMPSVSEPFGIAPLEAMSHRVPVIVSRQSGISEVVENCVKVDFWNVQEMADWIIRLLGDDQLRTDLVENGYEEIGSITWDAAAARMEDVYSHVLSRPLHGGEAA